jgi:outer membrane scaffolding protein for murein synthesis (MipA/OmpV family)
MANGLGLKTARWLLCVAAATAAIAAPAHSQDYTITLGVETFGKPVYDGSDTYEWGAVPKFGIRKTGTAPGFSMPSDGFGFALVDMGWLKAGPVGTLHSRRSDSDAPRGLNDIPWRVTAGGFVELWPVSWFRIRNENRFLLGDSGFDGSLAATAITKQGQWTFAGGGRMTYSDGDFNALYFGVSPAESSASGLAAYAPGGGIRTVGLEGKIGYDVSSTIRTYAFVNWDRLVGDAADSPIVKIGSEDQVTFGVGLTYDFNLR